MNDELIFIFNELMKKILRFEIFESAIFLESIQSGRSCESEWSVQKWWPWAK